MLLVVYRFIMQANLTTSWTKAPTGVDSLEAKYRREFLTYGYDCESRSRYKLEMMTGVLWRRWVEAENSRLLRKEVVFLWMQLF